MHITLVKLMAYVLGFFSLWYGWQIVSGVNPYGEDIWMGYLKMGIGALILYVNIFHVRKGRII